MAIVKTEYTGALSTSTTYALSENPILTKAKPFGPTDLLTASLGSCIKYDYRSKRIYFVSNI